MTYVFIDKLLEEFEYRSGEFIGRDGFTKLFYIHKHLKLYCFISINIFNYTVSYP